MIDWGDVHEEMLRLEDETPKRADDPDEVPNEVVMARLVGIPDSEAEALGAHVMLEVERAWAIMDFHRKRHGLESTAGNLLSIGILQGITFAAAVRSVQGNA